MNALGQAVAQQQFNALVDLCTYEELYAFFGGEMLRAVRSAHHSVCLKMLLWMDHVCMQWLPFIVMVY